MEQRTILRKRTIAKPKRSQTAAGAQDDPKKKDNSKAIPNSSYMEQRTILRKRTKAKNPEQQIDGAEDDPKKKDNSKAIPNSSCSTRRS
jgi:hypothetical protein